MGMVFLRAEALGAEQRALWGGRKRLGTGRRRGHGMPRQGTKGGAMASRGRKERGWAIFMVAAVLFVLRCAIEAATFLHIRDNKKMGLMGLMGLIGSGKNTAGMHGGRGCGFWGNGWMWLIDRLLRWIDGIKLQQTVNQVVVGISPKDHRRGDERGNLKGEN